MSDAQLNRTAKTDLAARDAIGRGERVLTWSEGRLVELVVDEHDRLIEIPRPDLVRKPRPGWRERLTRFVRGGR